MVQLQCNAMQRNRDQWKIKIDGIEGYPGYATPVHEYAYNNLMIGNALILLPSLADDAYDLVIAIDILEHLDKNPGKYFLEQCLRVCKGSVLISTYMDAHGMPSFQSIILRRVKIAAIHPDFI